MRGFTLMEMVITIVILAIIGLFTFSFLSNLTQTYVTMGQKRGAHQEAANILERISRELRDAEVVSVSGSAISFNIAHPVATDSSSNLFVRFRLSGSDLYRDSGPSSGSYSVSKILGKGVTSFTPIPSGTLPQNTALQVSLTVTSGGQTQTYVTGVCPKNYTTTGNCVFTGAVRDFGGCYEDRIY